MALLLVESVDDQVVAPPYWKTFVGSFMYPENLASTLIRIK